MHAIGSIAASGLTSCECSPTQAAGSGISRSHYGCSSLHPLVSKPAFNLHAGMPVESKPSEKNFMCVEVFVSVDGLCPEEGFKGVWVSRSIVVVVLVGL